MENIQNALKMAADGRIIKMKHALAIGERADHLLTKTASVLEKAMKQMGDIDGQECAQIIAEIKGQRFNAAAYSYDREPDGQ